MRRTFLLGLGLALVSSSPALGQAATLANRRQGVFLGVGLGVGSARLSCDICRDDRNGGGAGYVRFGLTASRNILLGIETLGWYDSGDVDQLLVAVQAIAMLYPKRTSGFYLKGGLGVSEFSAKDGDGNEVSSQAFALQVGLGLEVPVGRNLSMVPFANFLGSTGADVKFNSTVSSLSANTSLIQLGVGLTLH
jgi:hypothetical protein